MAESSNRTLVCSIVFLDIVEYSKKAVTEQMSLKQSFNAVVGAALEGIATRDRIVLDTGDGAAVTFLGDPEDALFAAMAMRDGMAASAGLQVRMGVNLGPARLIKDINNQLNIIGDGINVAQRVMSFAGTGQLLVSRSFYEVVSCLSADYARLFSYVGARTDKHVREHEVYAVGTGVRAARPPAERGAGRRGFDRLRAALLAPGPLGLLRGTWLAAPLLFVAIVAGALQVRAGRDIVAEPEPVVAAPPVKKAAAPRPAGSVAKAAAGAKPAAATGTGKLQFLLQPRGGEVVIDGRSLGLSPPLQEVELPAGPHLVEFRFGTYKPHAQRVELKPGESIRLVHRFK